VRGFDLSDISFIRGKTGWIVFDPLVSAEPVRAAWQLFQKHVGKGLPVSAVIYSHTHADHWGGVRGIVDEAKVRSGEIPVIAPIDFMNHTISENVYAGNAMNRRLFYQYGLLLPAAPHGYVGQGLGQGVSAGSVGLIAPNRYVKEPIEKFEVDGVMMVFQNTPNTEAPREMNTYIPGLKALWMAENVIASLHNIYTLRGAPVRDPLNWSKYIAQALHLFGEEAEVMFASHHWPRWGNARIQEGPPGPAGPPGGSSPLPWVEPRRSPALPPPPPPPPLRRRPCRCLLHRVCCHPCRCCCHLGTARPAAAAAAACQQPPAAEQLPGRPAPPGERAASASPALAANGGREWQPEK